jgi:hypothetical protein
MALHLFHHFHLLDMCRGTCLLSSVTLVFTCAITGCCQTIQDNRHWQGSLPESRQAAQE